MTIKMKKTMRSTALKALYCVLFVSSFSLNAQNVGINTTTPHSSAALEVKSTDKGLLVPRLTSNQVDDLPSPATGLLVFDTDENKFVYFDGTNWQPVAANVGDKVGSTTTHKVPKWDGTQLVDGQITDNGAAIGIGTTTPNSLLTVGSHLTFTGLDPVMTVNTTNAESILIGDSNAENGILLGRDGNQIQGRSGTNFVTNDYLLLNPNGGNVGINNTNPYAPLAVGADFNHNLSPIAQFNATGEKPLLIGETTNNKGLMLGYEGNDIQGRSGGGLSDNGHLVLNKFGGNVGIGTTTPTQAKLVINGVGSSQTLSHGYLRSTGTTSTESGVPANYSIYASDRIAATEFNAYSDRRIKHILRGSNSQEDLATLMKLKITDYKLIDSISKGHKEIKKVIAQEVAEVYPNAVSTMTDFIPNIYKLATIKDGFVALANHGLVVGDKVKLIFGDRQEVCKVLTINEKGFTVDSKPKTQNLKLENTEGGKSPTSDIPNPTSQDVFVFGKEVNDFHTVDYEALSTLNISATQELVKKINDLEAQNAALKTDVKGMKADIEQIKATIARKGM
jgi:hypothetical protein